MAEQFYTILTQVGKASIANASALGTKVEFKYFALGDGDGSYYNPTENQTELKNEVWRGQIGQVIIDEENPNWIVLETVIPANIGGFNIREAGVFDADGNLLAIGKYPETYKPKLEDGSAKDLYVRMILEVANTEVITLKIDPSIILATKKDIDTLSNRITKNSNDIAELKKGSTTIEELETNNKTLAGAINEVKTDLVAHKAESATDAHLPLNVGLGNVQNYGIASQAEAEAGIATNKYMTPERTRQAILKLAPRGYNLLQTISIPNNSINIVNITNLDAYENIFIYIPILDCVGSNDYIAISASPSPGATSRGYTITHDSIGVLVFTNIGAEQILPQTYAPNGIDGFMIEIKNNSSQRKIIEVMGHVGTTTPGYSLFRKLAYESTKITTVSLIGTENFVAAEGDYAVRVWGR